jgi:hypothetical protein
LLLVGNPLHSDALHDVLDGGTNGQQMLRLGKPILKERAQFAHVLERQVQRLEAGNC